MLKTIKYWSPRDWAILLTITTYVAATVYMCITYGI